VAVSASGLTLDTGALIALERGEKRMRTAVLRAEQLGMAITVPAVVIGEWWRGGVGRVGRQRAILEAVDVEPVSEQLGKLAGEAIAALPGATVVDAMVMASAAQRGDVVYTSDFEDLERLRVHFGAVHRVLRA
jgi:predicted nucleic acid-binding protein